MNTPEEIKAKAKAIQDPEVYEPSVEELTRRFKELVADDQTFITQANKIAARLARKIDPYLEEFNSLTRLMNIARESKFSFDLKRCQVSRLVDGHRLLINFIPSTDNGRVSAQVTLDEESFYSFCGVMDAGKLRWMTDHIEECGTILEEEARKLKRSLYAAIGQYEQKLKEKQKILAPEIVLDRIIGKED